MDYGILPLSMAIKARMEIESPAVVDTRYGYHIRRGAIINVIGLPTATGSTEPVHINLAAGVSPRSYAKMASAIFASQDRPIEWEFPSDTYSMDHPVVIADHKKKPVAFALRWGLFSVIPKLRRIR